ncbi:MAG: homocysteine S-methyltransferase family protein [Clostridiales bacterium]|nr:MAG: homocysteine S-methyltransferase family protein [Clostridiales bacterium]
MGASILGGCCGTTPEYIKRNESIDGKKLNFRPCKKRKITLLFRPTHARLNLEKFPF